MLINSLKTYIKSNVLNKMSLNYLSNIPKFYYINLERSKDRRERVETLFNKYNLKFTRVDAVDGKQMRQEDIDKRFINTYECGCVLSHLKAIETFYESGEEMGLICEDDISFDFLPLWKKPLSDVIKNAPSDWEIISLSYMLFSNIHHVKNHFNKEYNDFVKGIQFGALCYCINREGARKILEKHSLKYPNFESYTQTRPVADVIIYDLVKSYVYKYCLFTFPDDNQSVIFEYNHGNIHTNAKKTALYIFQNL